MRARQVPPRQHAAIQAALGKQLGAAGLPLVGALPHDRLISSVRLDEICAALRARVLSGSRGQQDLTVDQVQGGLFPLLPHALNVARCA